MRARGIRRLLFLSSSAIIRTPDWFLLRNFGDVGPAHEHLGLLPVQKAAEVEPHRNCRLFLKDILAPDAASASTPAGKRIGF